MTWPSARRLALALSLATTAVLHAAEVVSVRNGTIPSLPVPAAIERLFTLGGQPVALTGQDTWRLDEKGAAWTRIGWHPRTPLAATASDGRVAFALFAANAGGPI